MNKKLIKQDMFNWLCGIQEDDPLPYEINYILFIYETKNGIFELSYSASETKPMLLDFGEYFPLEAQYFFSQNFHAFQTKKSTKNLVDITKQICQELCQEISFLKDKKLIFGKRWDAV